MDGRLALRMQSGSSRSMKVIDGGGGDAGGEGEMRCFESVEDKAGGAMRIVVKHKAGW